VTIEAAYLRAKRRVAVESWNLHSGANLWPSMAYPALREALAVEALGLLIYSAYAS
jgi:hypothetical protein